MILRRNERFDKSISTFQIYPLRSTPSAETTLEALRILLKRCYLAKLRAKSKKPPRSYEGITSSMKSFLFI